MATQTDVKAEYNELIKFYETESPRAREVGTGIVKKLLKSSQNPAVAEIYSKIRTAADAEDFDSVGELHSQLKAIKDNEKTHTKALTEIRKTSWEDIQKAFRPEFEAMVYEAAIEATKAAHAAIQSSKSENKTRKPRTPKSETSAKEGEYPAVKIEPGMYTIKTKRKSFEMEGGKRGQPSYTEYSELLEDMGVEFSYNDKDKVILKNDFFLVDKDGSKRYKNGYSAIIKGIQNGLYPGVEIVKAPEAKKVEEK